MSNEEKGRHWPVKQGQYFNFMSQWFQSEMILLQQMIDNQRELTWDNIAWDQYYFVISVGFLVLSQTSESWPNVFNTLWSFVARVSACLKTLSNFVNFTYWHEPQMFVCKIFIVFQL